MLCHTLAVLTGLVLTWADMLLCRNTNDACGLVVGALVVEERAR